MIQRKSKPISKSNGSAAVELRNMVEDREHDFWNLLDNLKGTMAALTHLNYRALAYARDYTKACEVEWLITGLLANIDSLIEAAKAVQDVSRPITGEILKASLHLKNRMSQYKFDLRRCMDGSEDGIAVHHPRNIYSHTIPHVRVKAQEYDTIFDNLRFKVEAESEMQEQPTEESNSETERKIESVKEPSKIAMQAYLTLKALGCSQEKVAEIMTDKHKPKKPYKQWHISRWKIQCENWLKANNLDIFPSEMTKKIITMNPSTLDMGARTDGKTTGDERHKKLVDPDGDIYD